VFVRVQNQRNSGGFDLHFSGARRHICWYQWTPSQFPDDQEGPPWGMAVKARPSQVRWLGSPEGPFVNGFKQLICPTTSSRTRLFRLIGSWQRLISNFFDSWFGAGAKQASFSASQVGCKCKAFFPWSDWFAASRAVVMGFGALIALAMKG